MLLNAATESRATAAYNQRSMLRRLRATRVSLCAAPLSRDQLRTHQILATSSSGRYLGFADFILQSHFSGAACGPVQSGKPVYQSESVRPVLS